ncbi:MAG: hypothetical protein QM754_05430 [Tepidisphaeraceae bacterium]
MDQSGARFCRTDSVDEDIAFDDWNRTACDHQDGILLHHYLGNIARIELIRNGLSGLQDLFPIILGEIVHNAIHCCDWLGIKKVELLLPELARLSNIHPNDERQSKCVRDFESQLKELVAAALQVRKPISF